MRKYSWNNIINKDVFEGTEFDEHCHPFPILKMKLRWVRKIYKGEDTMSGKIIMNLAISLDGYIADENGGFDWIVGQGDTSIDTAERSEFEEFLKGIDIVVMGKNCYEQGFAKEYSTKTVYVATSEEKEDEGNIRFIRGDIVTASS